MRKGFIPAFILFILVTALVFIFKEKLFAAGANAWVIAGGNTILFIVTAFSIYMNMKAMNHSNTHGFMRNVMGGFLLKFFLIVAAAVGYIVLVKEINKPALLICMVLYLVYTF